MSKSDRKAHRALFDDTSKVIRRAEKLVRSLEAMLARRGDHKPYADLIAVVQNNLKDLRKDAVALDKLIWPKSGEKRKVSKATKTPALKRDKIFSAKPIKTEVRRAKGKAPSHPAGTVTDLPMQ